MLTGHVQYTQPTVHYNSYTATTQLRVRECVRKRYPHIAAATVATRTRESASTAGHSVATIVMAAHAPPTKGLTGSLLATRRRCLLATPRLRGRARQDVLGGQHRAPCTARLRHTPGTSVAGA